MDREAYIAALDEENRALVAAGRRGLDAVVPGCPGWTVADALHHIGSGHWWVDQVLRSSATNGYDVAMSAAPGRDQLIDWVEAGAERLAATFAEVDPSTPTVAMWTEDGRGTARFWLRRVPHHVAEHRWDVESAHGEPGGIAAELAADGLDQILIAWLPWAARAGRQAQGEWSGETVLFERTDGAGAWFIALEGSGEVTARRGPGRADLVIRGPAADLFLLAMNRIPLTASALDVRGAMGIHERWADQIRWGTAANTRHRDRHTVR